MSGTPATDTAVQQIESELLVLLTRVRRRRREAAHRVHPELGAVGYAVLLRVHRDDATRAADLVTALDLDKGLVSRALGQLERLGLVTRTTDTDDARVQRVSVTDAGRRAVEAGVAEGRTELQRSLATWSPEEVAAFAAQLHRYNEAFGS